MERKSMRKRKFAAKMRRLTSILLVLVMMPGLVPMGNVPASLAADGSDVEYSPKYPEVAILNAETGQDVSFYSRLLGTETSYPLYNAVSKFENRAKKGSFLSYSDKLVSGRYDFDFTDAPVMKKLANPEKNLKANVSASFNNNIHEHSYWSLGTIYTATVATSQSINVGIGGERKKALQSGNNYESSKLRLGDYTSDNDEYITVSPYSLEYEEDVWAGSTYYGADNLTLTIYRNSPVYNGKVCSCGGSSVENILVTFRDTKAPQLTNVEYSVENGDWTSKSSGIHVRGGQTLRIKLIYDEYIRFADDNGSGKGSLYLDLRADKQTQGNYKANLTELKDNYMIFSYKVGSNTDEDITELDLSSLFKSSALVQVAGSKDKSFKLNDRKYDRNGFDKSSCIVTDLAGNPLAQKSIADPKLELDAGSPEVGKVIFNLGLNNTDVKQALGKTDVGDKDYTDASDINLGVGDTLNATIQMNEQLKGLHIGEDGGNRYLLSSWGCVTATTNILDKNNEPVKLTSLYFTPYKDSQSGGVSSESGKTSFVMKGVTVEDGWHLASGDTIVKIKSIKFNDNIYEWFIDPQYTWWDDGPDPVNKNGYIADKITDLAGNEPDKNKDGEVIVDEKVHHNRIGLDTTAPTATMAASFYADEDAGFRCGIDISDAGSGAAGIYGSFILHNGGDKASYQYEWAVTAKTDTTGANWQTGVIGVSQQFKQIEGINYLHVRPKNDENYVNLSNCSITVKAKDYAGNEGQMNGGVDWYVDRKAPSVRGGTYTRTLNSGSSDTGTLNANVILSDEHGISKWQYAWSTDPQNAPTNSDAWTQGALSESATSGEITLSAAATVKNEKFEKYLWVKANDNSKNRNKAVICTGIKYTYDLSSPDYTLEYSTAIQTRTSLKVNTLGSEDVLLVLIQAPDNPEYYVVRKIDKADSNDDIFSPSGLDDVIVMFYKITENNGIYTLTEDTDKKAKGIRDSVCGGSYSGNLDVKILSGKKTALTYTSNGFAGNETNHFSEETISFRVAGSSGASNYSEISFKSVNGLGKEPTNNEWKSGTDYYLSTLAGRQFEISIGKDNNGWNYEDVDTENSYIAFVNQSTSDEDYKVKLGPFQISEDKKASQIVTVPELDSGYASGVYKVKLCLKFLSEASEYSKTLQDSCVVDATEPNQNFALSSIKFDTNLTKVGGDYGLSNIYGDSDSWSCYNAGPSADDDNPDVIYIPYNGQLDITVKSSDETVLGTIAEGSKSYNTGRYYVKIWNKDAPDYPIYISPESEDVLDSSGNTTAEKRQTTAVATNLMPTTKTTTGNILLNENELNTLAMQKVYENGRTSDVKHYSVYYDTKKIEGNVSISKTKGQTEESSTDAQSQVVFTPDRDSAAAAASANAIYAWAWQHGEDPSAGERIDMTAESDGTWRCKLDPGYIYQVVTITNHGNCVAAGIASQRAPWFTNIPTSTKEASSSDDKKIEGLSVADNGDGTYTLEFCVRDDLNNDGEYTFNVSFNEEYSAQSSTFTKDDSDKSITSSSGIYYFAYPDMTSSVGMTKNRAYSRWCRTFTMKGYYANVSDSSTKMDVTVSVTDSDGLTGSVTSTGNDVHYVEPQAYTADDPSTADVNEAPHFTDGGMQLTFNQPVRPADSWAWNESADDKLSATWTNAFPISGNGKCSIEYYDMFGNLHLQTIDIKDAFTINGIDYSLSLSLSETAFTTEPVILTSNIKNGTVLVLSKGGNPPDERFYEPMTGEQSNEKTQNRMTELKENNTYYVRLHDINGWEIMDLPVRIDNIVTGAPKAAVYYDVEELGREFTKTELEDYIKLCGDGGELAVAGNVTVRYTTSRHVTPTDGTGSTYVFKPDSTETSYTFKFVDDMKNSGSVTASLPAGLKLRQYKIPRTDTDPPVVKADVYALRGGIYTREASFLGTQDESGITSILDELSYVQGYSIVLNVSDESDYSIKMSESTGDSTTGGENSAGENSAGESSTGENTTGGDSSAEGSTAGAKLVGNTLIVSKAGTYIVTVTDAAKNVQQTKITVPKRIDTTGPTISLSETAKSLYEILLTVEVTDKDDYGSETVLTDGEGNKLDSIFLIQPADATHEGINKYTYLVKNNGQHLFKFRDLAGNVQSKLCSISTIDEEPPKLTASWSPSDSTEEDGFGKYPTTRTVNTDITAHIDSNKTMSDVTVRAGNESEGDDHTILKKGEAQAYSILDPNNSSKVLVSFEATAERITVTFAENYNQYLTFTATAPNGNSETLTLNCPTNIDKVSPVLTETRKMIYRKGTSGAAASYAKPYKAEITLSPSETVTSTNYGGWVTYGLQDGTILRQPACYNGKNPLVLSFTENGTYNVIFSDSAGNVTVHPVVIDNIDSTAPALELSDVSSAPSRLSYVSAKASEDCTLDVYDGDKTQTYSLSAGVAKQIEFTKNGTYAITAIDYAGNKTTKYVDIGNIDDVAPVISFTNGTVYVKAGELQKLEDALARGYEVSDNVTKTPDVACEYSNVRAKIDTAGQYIVVYTITDEAGNQTTANRFVRIVGSDTVCLNVDGELIIPGSTAVIEPGDHQLTLENNSIGEPYTVKARKGILSKGQMKYLSGSSISFDKNGNFNVESPGYYTLLVTTQSRQTIRILLYVEK